MHIHVHNASEGLSRGLAVVLTAGQPRQSRNGPVRALDDPLTITYLFPDQRVLFYPQREANPFFHLYECLWMMAGRNDVAGVAEYVPGMRNYSDNGRTFNGAYGHRWRKHFGVDQIEWLVERLSQPGALDDRRAHISMFDPRRDQKLTLDVPCNHGISFRGRSDGRLDMTVYNRSNDLVLGAFGANVVHMSFLHEFVCLATGLPMGRYHQVTNDMHLYQNHPTTAACCELAGVWQPDEDRYITGQVRPFPIMDTPWRQWLEDLEMFLRYGNVVGLRDRFFRRVAAPVVLAHEHYKSHKGLERYDGALEILDQCLALDWKMACQEWLERRKTRWLEKAS